MYRNSSGTREKVIEMNFKCIEEGFAFLQTIENGKLKMENLPKPNLEWKDHLLITGSEAMGLGLIHAGCRMYCGYPMTPSSQLLELCRGHAEQDRDGD